MNVQRGWGERGNGTPAGRSDGHSVMRRSDAEARREFGSGREENPLSFAPEDDTIRVFCYMQKTNLADIPLAETASPRGRYRRFSLDLSAALAARRNGAPQVEHCPFEVELVRLPPRATNWPFHAHSAQWELYIIVSGRGQARTQQGRFEVRDGDCLLHPPGEPHQLTNTGAGDLLYYVVANNPTSDVTFYPDSGKYALPNQAQPFRVQRTNYYDGEE